MFTTIVLVRYIMYIFTVCLFNHFLPQFSKEFLLICGVLAEVLDWKYNSHTEEE